VGHCRDYDTAISTCPGTGTIKTVIVNADCHLETINVRSSYEAGLSLIYDTTTYELVGATIGTDSGGFECGEDRVLGFRAGIRPPASCASTWTTTTCWGDG
jgi:hypothetical protein